MDLIKSLLAGTLGLLLSGCGMPWHALSSHRMERHLDHTFTVEPGSLVAVNISGGAITTTTGGGNTVEVRLTQRIDAGSDREADALLGDYDIEITQDRGEVTVRARRNAQGLWDVLSGNRVQFTATLRVPPDVRLDLDTSGGSITVRGDREAEVRADTSGGSISVDGGAGELTLDTSGGGIKVGRALRALNADTSGGSITVDYVGPAAKEVNLDTSGGSIRVGVDADAALHVTAGTSGGSVRIEDLPFDSESTSRSHARGKINGGGGQLRANTSGGSIAIRAATE